MLGQMHSLQEIYLEDNNDLEVWCYPKVKYQLALPIACNRSAPVYTCLC